MRKIPEFFALIATLVILSILMSFIGTPKNVLASWNETNVTVQVGDVSQITVMPTLISWSSVNPGTTGGMTHLQIKNSGSRNVTNIYAHTDTLTTESSNPITAGVSTAFSSGGVLVIKSNETGALYNYTDRLEWNVSIPAGAGSTNCGGAVAWGYFRNTSNEYVWCLKNGTVINSTHGCNSSSTIFYIETDVDNGTTASRNPDISGGSVSGQKDWGLFSFSSGPLNGHCVAAAQDCTKILIYRYDKRSPFDQCGEASYIRSARLTPGDEFTINLDAWVPKGIPYGWMASSWLTLEGTAET